MESCESLYQFVIIIVMKKQGHYVKNFVSWENKMMFLTETDVTFQ